MLRRLKSRRPVDVLVNEPRVDRQIVIRWIYLSIVLVFAVWLGDLFLGGFFYLRSEGMVLGEPMVVAAEFPVTVRDIRVKEGERVTAGQVVAVVTSQTVTADLARLAGEQADRALRLSELQTRSQTVSAIIGIAERRQNVTVEARRKFDTLIAQGWLPIDKGTAAVESEFRSSENLAQLQAQRSALGSEIATLTAAFAQADNAVNDLRRLHNDGQLRAPADGLVGLRLTNDGAVLSSGQPLLEIYGDQRVVLAYLPIGGLFDVAAGDRVEIRTGLQTFYGTITRVEPIAAAMPREFQRAFTPIERRQVIRVAFDPGPTPPLFTKVTLRAAGILPAWLHRVVRHVL